MSMSTPFPEVPATLPKEAYQDVAGAGRKMLKEIILKYRRRYNCGNKESEIYGPRFARL